jgi:phosphoribosylglycinamide formyltransferase-1
MAMADMPPGHRFVSERIEPLGGMFDTGRMAMGEPGLPRRFRWRGQEYEVAQVLDRWKTSGDCRNGSDERYVRKHWYLVATADGGEMRLYFDRQPRPGATRSRWWLATFRPAADPS